MCGAILIVVPATPSPPFFIPSAFSPFSTLVLYLHFFNYSSLLFLVPPLLSPLTSPLSSTPLTRSPLDGVTIATTEEEAKQESKSSGSAGPMDIDGTNDLSTLNTFKP
jgi:hypothetical protein